MIESSNVSMVEGSRMKSSKKRKRQFNKSLNRKIAINIHSKSILKMTCPHLIKPSIFKLWNNRSNKLTFSKIKKLKIHHPSNNAARLWRKMLNKKTPKTLINLNKMEKWPNRKFLAIKMVRTMKEHI